MAALDTLLATPSADGAKAIRALTGHPNESVRLRAYRYMCALVFPRDREAMTGVIEQMLTDNDELVRLEGARLVKNLKMADGMREFLRDWVRQAAERQWDRSESYSVLRDLAK
jgi:HEAT repeat protein